MAGLTGGSLGVAELPAVEELLGVVGHTPGVVADSQPVGEPVDLQGSTEQGWGSHLCKKVIFMVSQFSCFIKINKFVI